MILHKTGKFSAVSDIRLVINVLEMRFYRGKRDKKTVGGLLRGLSLQNEVDDFTLTGRKQRKIKIRLGKLRNGFFERKRKENARTARTGKQKTDERSKDGKRIKVTIQKHGKRIENRHGKHFRKQPADFHTALFFKKPKRKIQEACARIQFSRPKRLVQKDNRRRSEQENVLHGKNRGKSKQRNKRKNRMAHVSILARVFLSAKMCYSSESRFYAQKNT